MKETTGEFTRNLIGKIVRFGAPDGQDPKIKQVEPYIRTFQNDDGSIGEVCYFDIRVLGTGQKVKVHARGDELFEIITDGTKYDYEKEKEVPVPKAELSSRVRLSGYLKTIEPYKHEDGRMEPQKQMNIAGDESFSVIVRKRKRKPAKAKDI
jgi:hypothetical protein